jgi:Zn-finger nucleic acid-binding protein
MIAECPGCRVRYDLSGRRVGSRVRCRCGTGFVVPQPKLEAGVLQCAACGAHCAPDDSSCSYCNAILAVIACPACFGRVYAGAEHCAHCGAEVLVGARRDPALIPVRSCPRCEVRSELAPRLVVDTLLDECQRCNGVWVDHKVFESLVKNRDQQARLEAAARPELTIDALRPPSSKSAPTSRSAREYIPCPDCRQLMNRKNFGNISGVLVDVCKPHGVWFDTGELGRIIQFVMRGGLVESRQRELAESQREAKDKRVREYVLSGSAELRSEDDDASWVAELLRIFFRWLQ